MPAVSVLMASRLLAVLAVTFLVAGCRVPGSGCNTAIDWVDFIQIGSVQYVAGANGAPATVAQGELGPVVTHVKFKVDGNVCDPNYKVKDGDAAFIEPGTPIYSLITAQPGAAVAAMHDGKTLRYTPFGATGPPPTA